MCKYGVSTVRTYLLAGSMWTSLSNNRHAPSPNKSNRLLTLEIRNEMKNDDKEMDEWINKWING